MHIKELYQARDFNQAAISKTSALLFDLHCRPAHKTKDLLPRLREAMDELVDARNTLRDAIYKAEQLELV